MKHSLTVPQGPVSALFDLLASGLAGSAAGKRATSEPAVPSRSFFDRLEHRLWRSRQRELERFLSTSVDVADLEGRLQQLERRSFHRYT